MHLSLKYYKEMDVKSVINRLPSHERGCIHFSCCYMSFNGDNVEQGKSSSGRHYLQCSLQNDMPLMIEHSMSSQGENNTCWCLQTLMKKINKCKRHDGEGDSDHGVLISGKVPQEAGSMKTDGHMVHRFPYEASLTTRNPFMRWLSACNATNLGLMKNTGAACQQWGLSTIPKRISESPDVPCIEFDSAVLIPAGLFKTMSYQVIYSTQRVLYTTEMFRVIVSVHQHHKYMRKLNHNSQGTTFTQLLILHTNSYFHFLLLHFIYLITFATSYFAVSD